jgi:DNA-3-methyladenine glycosylase II
MDSRKNVNVNNLLRNGRLIDMAETHRPITSLDAATMLEAISHLKQSDRIMALLINRLGTCNLHEERRAPFESLLRAIVSQQLSTKASQAILNRLQDLMGTRFNQPESYLEASAAEIKTCGISNAKVRAIRSLSEHAKSGKLDYDSLSNLEDEQVVKALTEIWGIGIWSAQMFLIFCLRRPNVITTIDAGLLRSHNLLYPGEKFSKATNRWSPFCSVAAWYLWRAIDELSKQELDSFAAM